MPPSWHVAHPGPTHVLLWPARLVQLCPKAPPLQRLPWPAGLAKMKEAFESNLSASQKEELANQRAYEDLKAATEAEIAAGQQQLETKTGELADTDEKNAQANVDVEDTKASLSADEQFLMRLRAQDEEFLMLMKAKDEEFLMLMKAAKEAEISLQGSSSSSR